MSQIKREEINQVTWDEMKKITQENVCGICGGELTVRTNPETGNLEIWCPHNPDHHGYVERETYTQAMRRGEVVHPVIQAAIEKKMLLPGGYPLGIALALIKVRFPRADLDDPSAALFVMDCLRLDLDPLLGEIVPVTFKSTDKVTGEVRKVVTPILTEDGWLSLAARACPDRWAGPPSTEPITDKALKKDLCDDEEAWVWKATGRTKDGSESTTYGWLKQSEYKRAKEAHTPAGELPGNQARVRAIKRWVRETFPEAKARMKEMTAEWLARGKDVEGVQQIIEAEYHIVTELPPPKPEGEDKIGTKDEGGGEKKPAATSLASPKGEKKPKPRGEPPAAELEGEGFHIDMTWLKESLETLKWTEGTTETFLVSKYKVDPRGTLEDILKRLTRKQAEEFVNEILSRTQKQMELW